LITARFFDRESAATLEECGFLLSNGGVAYDAVDNVITQEMHDALMKSSAWIAGIPPVTRELLARYPHLKIIARRGVGYDTIDVKAIKELGRVLTTTPGSNEATVADHTVGLMLAVGKRFLQSHRRMQSGEKAVVVGNDLYRKTVGLVGLGRIARQVAQRLKGFEVRLISHDLYPDMQAAADLGVEYVPLKELLAQSDYVSLHAPLTEKTRNLVNAETLQLFKPGAILVNTARGELIDDTALLAALKDRRLGGAGLDVLGSEHDASLEPITQELLNLPNVICTQHTGGSSHEGLQRANLLAAQCVIAVLQERPLNPACVVTDGRSN
jgi:D-3-phosphoglycerate dehydrogenase